MHPTCWISQFSRVWRIIGNTDANLPLSELAEKLWSRDYAVPDEKLFAKIDKDIATNSGASKQDIVSHVFNLNTEESYDENDIKGEKKSASEILKTKHDLRRFRCSR